MDNLTKVFVYGTLKSGGLVRGLDKFPGATIVGKATTIYPDYDMIDLGSFPGVVLKGTNKIVGEVWEVDAETLELLDQMEGYPAFYDRTVVHTTEGKAWMYYLERDEYQDYIGNQSNSIVDINNTLAWKHD